MVMVGRPQRGRPVTAVPVAARLLGRDVRTVRRMIESGELEGAVVPGRQRRRWFVYSDQLPGFAPSTSPRLRSGSEQSELAVLREENADLRARAQAAEEGERLLLAKR